MAKYSIFSGKILVIKLMTFVVFYFHECICKEIRFVNMEYLHEESLNTMSGLTNGALVSNMFLDTCLFQAASGPVMMCIPKCKDDSNCLAVSMNRSHGCLMCRTDGETGRSFADFESTSEIFVRLDQLESFIDGKWPYIIGPERLNWTEAKQYCYDRSAHLAIIPEAGEQSQIKTLLRDLLGFRDYLWIGGNDFENEGDWKWISKQVTYMNVTDEQRNMNGNYCIALRPSDGLWNVTVCDVTSSFPLCEIQETTPSYVVGPNKTSWDEAVHFCMSNMSNLVTIADETELLSILTWLNTDRGDDWFWIGASFNVHNDAWLWVEEPVISTLWRDDEPNGGLDENCMGFHKWKYGLYDHVCWYVRFPLCEMP